MPDSGAFFAPVSESEAGQKLLRFLERRLGLPQALLHRWIRTGQIRVGGKRCKPFARVNAGDLVRLPPFALELRDPRAGMEEAASWPEERIREALAGEGLQLIGVAGPVWALDKPAGLPAQGGTGHDDSVADRLKRCFQNCAYAPAPAHRLDRDTGGVLLAGAAFEAQRKLHDDLAAGVIRKEYLAVCKGRWPREGARLVRHHLVKAGPEGAEKAVVISGPAAGARLAECAITPLALSDGESLLQIRLFTGRFNQIRAQLAALGHPVLGDGKYGAFEPGGLRLHAFRAVLPEGEEFISRPGWFDAGLPPPMADASDLEVIGN